MPRLPLRIWLFLGTGLLVLSSSAILVRYAEEAPPLTLATWRTVFAALLLLPFALGRALPEMRRFPRRDWGLILAAGTFLSLHFVTWVTSLYYTSVASASVLVTTSPVFLALFGYFILKEKLRRRTVVAILVAMAGSVLIAVGDFGHGSFPQATLGNALATLSALLVTFYLLIGRAVRQRVSWLAYVFPLYAVVALVTLVVTLLAGAPLFVGEWKLYLLFLAMAVGPSLLGHGMFNYALKFFPAAVVGLLSLSEPVGAAVLAYLLFGEVPRPLALGGMVVVLGGIALVVWRRSATGAAAGESVPVEAGGKTGGPAQNNP